MATCCKICQSAVEPAFKGLILGKYNVQYFECMRCKFVQTEAPYWLTEAYTSPITLADTGIVQRNKYNAKLVLATTRLLNLNSGCTLDYAGGYGILTRMLRDFGLDAYWSDKYSENLLARGFEYEEGNVELITAFEAFEHFEDPIGEFENMISISQNILISTSLVPDVTPQFSEWWYFGPEHGQHISLYRHETLSYLAEKYNKYFISDGREYHLFSETPISRTKWKALNAIYQRSEFFACLGLKSKLWEDHLRFVK